MSSTWRKVKVALGLNLCAYVPRTLEDPPFSGGDPSTDRLSDAVLLSPLTNWDMGSSRPMTPTPSSHGLRLSKSGSKSSKVCAIFLINFAALIFIVSWEIYLILYFSYVVLKCL